MSVVLGVDTGGTFTDFVLVDHAKGTIVTTKVPSTPRDAGEALATGLANLKGKGVERIDRVIIATTVATNAVIQRQGPRVVLVTNRDFEDVLFIGRIDKERIYDLNWRKPKPLVARRDCVGIGGRFDAHGRELLPLDEAEIAALKERLAAYAGEDVSIAVCCLFAYLNGEHERRAADAVREVLPEAPISVSHEVSPLWREYERTSTTVADAFVKPVVSRYVERVGSVLDASEAARHWNVLASNGGYLRSEQALRRPAQLLISGLAGGVMGGRHFAERAGHEAAFILDMGGTSSDIGLVVAGSQQYTTEFKIAFGIPVTIPCVAVETIGAGGGSIGWIDKGGFLHVGPRSAGAEPGPAAYGKGGVEPTVTDANIVLGRLDPNYFLGGAMKLDAAAARTAVAKLGEALGLTTEQAALAIVRTADENMANAIRLIAVERGLDPRDFALIAFGGAGPLHGRAVAERLGMRTVIVPPHPGLCSAFGAAIAEARVDKVQTYFTASDDVDFPGLVEAVRRLRAATLDELRASVDVEKPEIRTSADMRYAGQNYEVEVPFPPGELDEAGWATTLEKFGEVHAQLYGFDLPGEPVELINLRVTAVSPEPASGFSIPPPAGRPASERPVWFDAEGGRPCRILSRGQLAQQGPLVGPAIVEEVDSTTVVYPGDEVRVEESGVMILSCGGAR
ncbi:MAG: hydantoinase/oxoprolinase family protein [Geminicoccaceae bacterium]